MHLAAIVGSVHDYNFTSRWVPHPIHARLRPHPTWGSPYWLSVLVTILGMSPYGCFIQRKLGFWPRSADLRETSFLARTQLWFCRGEGSGRISSCKSRGSSILDLFFWSARTCIRSIGIFKRLNSPYLQGAPAGFSPVLAPDVFLVQVKVFKLNQHS
jgi:hypothetical protein